MSHPPITLRLTARWLAGALALLALATGAAPASGAGWRLEPIPDSANVAELHDLAFDAQGRGLLAWNGAQRDHTPPVFGALATRDPAGGWQRPTDLRGAFQPVTGEPVVAVPFLVSRTVAVAAAVGPPSPPP